MTMYDKFAKSEKSRYHLSCMGGMCDMDKPYFDTIEGARAVMLEDYESPGGQYNLPYIIEEEVNGEWREIFCYDGTN